MEIKNEYLRDLYRRVEKRNPMNPNSCRQWDEVLQSPCAGGGPPSRPHRLGRF